MGEVYRADDLKLGQPVALKFLPEKLASEPAWIERFYAEVRHARGVSHPNVCRVYDVGEIEGRHFLSMEYVDGEDLASLLRRIGRLPQDKAVEIARELCAGARRGARQGRAAPGPEALQRHDRRPRPREITDFGLAAGVEDDKGGAEVSGTPAYMAPEQLSGKGASVQSDIYALGLVLYEIFTGRKAFEAATLADWKRKHSEEPPTAPSTVTPGLDPAVERVILRCLEKDPKARPRSVAAVAARAARRRSARRGDRRRRDAFARDGRRGGQRRRHETRRGVGLSGLDPRGTGARRLALAARLPPWARAAGEAARSPRRTVEGDHPEVRLHREAARTPRGAFRKRASTGAGSRSTTNRRTAGRTWKTGVRRRSTSGTGRVPLRSSRSDSAATAPASEYSDREPIRRRRLAGMVGVELDPTRPPDPLRGGARLRRLPRRPPTGRRIGKPSLPKPGWIARPSRRPSRGCLPPFYADARTAWAEGKPERADRPLRVEAAAHRGRPVYFELVGPWSHPPRMPPAESTSGFDYGASSSSRASSRCCSSAAPCLPAETCAWAAATAGEPCVWRPSSSSVSMLDWALETRHVGERFGVSPLFIQGLGVSLFVAGLSWLIYIALEPLIRRRWPDSLIAWTRLLSGRFTDPLVGRVLLAGALLGVFEAIASGGRAAHAPGRRGDAADPSLPVGSRRCAGRDSSPATSSPLRRSPCSSLSGSRCSSSFCGPFFERNGWPPEPSP